MTYRAVDKAYDNRPEQRKRNAARKRARYGMVKKGKAHKGDGKDVDHADRNPSNNSEKNLSMQSKKKNRGRNR